MALIFYKNIKKHQSTEEKNLVFSLFEDGMKSEIDDSVAGPNICKNFYNLSYSDGALKTGLGFKDLEVPSNTEDLETCHTYYCMPDFVDEIEGLWLDSYYSKDEGRYEYMLYFYASDKKLYEAYLIDTFYGMVFSTTDALTTYPFFQCHHKVGNQDCIVFFADDIMVSFCGPVEYNHTGTPALISCVEYYDKLFGIAKTNLNQLIYTTIKNLNEWTEAKSTKIDFMDEKGFFTTLVSFKDYVYLFREYGITRLSVFSSKDDYSYTHLYTSTSKIFEKSVCVCGDSIFFMTRNGLYSFNGSSVTKRCSDYDDYFKNLDNTNCRSACLNGKYYFATKCKFDDDEKMGCENGEYVNNVLFEIDIHTFALNVYRGVDVRDMVAIDNPYMCKLCACFYNEYKQHLGQLEFNGKTFNDVNKKSWKSYSTDLNCYGKRKKIKKIVLKTIGNIQLEIVSDEETKIINFNGDDKEQEKSVCIYGKTFQFCFKTDEAQCEISKPMIVFDVVS